jgi:hypothetical protein
MKKWAFAYMVATILIASWAQSSNSVRIARLSYGTCETCLQLSLHENAGIGLFAVSGDGRRFYLQNAADGTEYAHGKAPTYPKEPVEVRLHTGQVAPYHSAPQPSYYDNRERVAARMTFEWTESSSVRIPLEWITNHNKKMIDYVFSLAQSDEAQSAKTPPQAFDDMLSKLLIDEKIANMVFELTAYYTIERYSEQIHIRTQKQAIDINQAKVLDNMFEYEAYLQGNFVIEVSHDPSDGQITAVQLARCDADVSGFGSPFGGAQPEWLVVYAGVSPFRLYGRKLEEWRLVSVSPREWVFELPREPENKSSNQHDEILQTEVRTSSLRTPYVRFHLDRHYQDALSRLEIRYSDDTIYTWRTLRYKQIEGVWFPSEVELTAKSPSQETRTKMVLVNARRTKSPIELRIPEKTPVFDYRHLGIEAWKGTLEYEQTEWSEALLKSLYQPAKESSVVPKR